MVQLLLIVIAIGALIFAGLAFLLYILRTGNNRRFCNNADLETSRKLVCTCNGHQDTSCRNTVRP